MKYTKEYWDWNNSQDDLLIKILSHKKNNMRRIKKPLDDKVKFIPCNENRLIYSYTRTDKKSTRKEKLNK